MILEVDCGNSLIKWRVVAAGTIAPVAGGITVDGRNLLESLAAAEIQELGFIRLASVRSEQETAELAAALRSMYFVGVSVAQAARQLGGVKSGYRAFSRLGVDRWLAIVGAHAASASACLVLDLGTAITSDFVSNDGQHLGGYIAPGLILMREQLLAHTSRIRFKQGSQPALLDIGIPGRSTAEAVERGCLHMLRGFVESQLQMAKGYWGSEFDVFLTGGDAGLASELVPFGRYEPDLIFAGLALACPDPRGS